MPHIIIEEQQQPRHSDDIQDIISAPPSWLLQWGITSIVLLITIIVTLSAFIKYPDIVRAELKITSFNSPKLVVTKVPGRLSRLLVVDNQVVHVGQPLAYIESTANHSDVILLIDQLHLLLKQFQSDGDNISSAFYKNKQYRLGELQPVFQIFYQEFITYQASVNSGAWIKKQSFLQEDLVNILKQREQLQKQKLLQQRDYTLATEEFEMHRKLFKEKVETLVEFRDAESRYISKQFPLPQTDAALLSTEASYSAKQKEILELTNQVKEEKAKFYQALNSLISQADEWKNKYILSASQKGKVAFVGVLQTNQVLQAGQEVFYINPENNNYFGEMVVPQDNMGKIKKGQRVLVKLKSFPFEEYGMLCGKITNINDVPFKDSIFYSQVSFDLKSSNYLKRPVHLKQGMLADAEIITEDATVLQRIFRNFSKMINK